MCSAIEHILSMVQVVVSVSSYYAFVLIFLGMVNHPFIGSLNKRVAVARSANVYKLLEGVQFDSLWIDFCLTLVYILVSVYILNILYRVYLYNIPRRVFFSYTLQGI